ncbi:unnamed protein product [Parascedosporium putredinis]|uniref:LPXTG-domain-containing protein n=1 Tax=Parascedosporium putredinis TaxID=1442378 RepID=A0A9P1H1S4_9PEZI|nr:unnamed protein product [Parascedosporium putredinis]CAI7992997.1 unnamed protein product [Parascedosporium putredinis]
MDEEGGDPFSPDSSSTNATDIVCQDSKFANDAVGIKYKSCLECLQKSQKTNGTESDISWLLYNLRFALGTCLYGFEDKDKDAILDKNLDPDSDSLDYCTASNSALFGKTLKSCVACLKSSDDETYLGNYSSGDDEEEKEPGASPNSLTTGTIVGIAIGAALFVFGGFALWFVYRKKKRSTSMDQDQNEGVEDPNSRSSSRTMISHAQPWIASERKALHSTSSSRASNYADTYGEKDDAPRSKKTIGGGINSNIPSSRTHQYSHNHNNSRSFSGQNSLDPAHAAYMSHDGRSSATPSPQPGYGNYAGAYNPNTSAPNPHPLRSHIQNYSRMHSREPSLDSRSSTPQPAATSTAAATTSAAPTAPLLSKRVSSCRHLLLELPKYPR